MARIQKIAAVPGGLGGGVAGSGGDGGGGGNGGDGAGWLSAGGNNPGTFPAGTGGSALPTFQGGRTVGCVQVGPANNCYNTTTGSFGGGGSAGYDGGGGGGGRNFNAGIEGTSGGGGSYIARSFSSFIGQSGVRSGSGLITINLLPVPEASTWAMLLLGFGGVGGLLRFRRSQRKVVAALA